MILDDKLVSYVLYKKRTISEVREKCRKLGFTEEYVDEIIEYLVENGYLDDEKYVMKYILEIILNINHMFLRGLYMSLFCQ